jgi:hypothetical protein
VQVDDLDPSLIPITVLEEINIDTIKLDLKQAGESKAA